MRLFIPATESAITRTFSGEIFEVLAVLSAIPSDDECTITNFAPEIEI